MLLHHLRSAAAELKSATRRVTDWRVRESLAGAVTALHCAIRLQERIEGREMKAEQQPPDRKDY